MYQFANLSSLAVKKLILERMKSPKSASASAALASDPFLIDVACIGALLSSEQRCLKYASRLNDALLKHAGDEGVMARMTAKSFFGKPQQALRTTHGGSITKTIGTGDDEVSLTIERHKHHKVLSGFLSKYEATQQFNQNPYSFTTANKVGPDVTLTVTPGKAVTLPARVDEQVFRQQLLARAQHFKDPSVGVMHGEFTHRIQWYLIGEYHREHPLSHAPADIFKACARPIFCDSPKTSVWDLVFEGAYEAGDFRKPEKLTEFLLRASRPEHTQHGKLWFLAALTEGRFAKRTIEKERDSAA